MSEVDARALYANDGALSSLHFLSSEVLDSFEIEQ